MAFTTLPGLVAGEVITGDDVAAIEAAIAELRPIVARCSSPLTKNNNTTLGDITGCSAPLTANATYYICGHVTVNGNGTADFKVGWTFPVGTTMRYALWGFNAGANATFVNAIQTDVTVWGAGGIATGGDDVMMFDGYVFVGATAGTLQMQGAQNTANVSDTIFRATTTYFELELRNA